MAERLHAWSRGFVRQRPLFAASLLLVVAYVTFTLTSVLVRMAVEDVPIFMVIYIRQVIGLLILSPFFIHQRVAIVQSRHFRLHGLRGLTAIGGMFCGLTSVTYAPLADVTAIQMSEVLFTTLLAASFFGEEVDRHRWSVVFVGFAGVLIMLRPFSDGFNSFMLIALVGAVFNALSVLVLRMGSNHDSAVVVMFYQGIVIIVLMSIPAFMLWQPVSLRGLGVVVMMSLLLAGGQWLFTLAVRIGEASALAPLNYIRLVMMALVGWFLYGEQPGTYTLIGGVLIVGSVTYTIQRNAKGILRPDAAK
jgi:drug/metabolite transporter (DMT)-like permease